MWRRRKIWQAALICFLLLILSVAYVLFSRSNSTQGAVLSILQRYEHDPKLRTALVTELAELPESPYPHLVQATVVEEDGKAFRLYTNVYAKLPSAMQTRLGTPLTAPIRQRRAEEMLESLFDSDPDLGRMLFMLQATNTRLRTTMVETLLKRIPSPQEWPYESLARQATNTAPFVQEFIVEVLQEAGERGRPTTPHLLPLLDHSNEAIALKTAKTICIIGGDTNRVVTTLTRLLDSNDYQIQAQAAYQLVFIVPEHPRLPAAFLKMAKTEDYSLRAVALNHIPYCGKSAAIHLTEIKKYLKDEHYGVRLAATNAVQYLDNATTELPPLGKMSKFAFETSFIKKVLLR